MNFVNHFIFAPPAPVVLPFVSTWDTTKISSGSSTASQIKLPLPSNGVYDFVVDWGDGLSNIITVYNQAEVTHNYSVSGIKTITITGVLNGWLFNGNGDRLKITSVLSWGAMTISNAAHIFSGCANLNLSTVSDILNTSQQVYFSNMFTGCTSLTSVNNINLWATNSVLTTDGMFDGCVNFNQALSFNTLNVTSFNSMFKGCLKFNSAISFNTSNSTNFSNMFSGASIFNQEILFNVNKSTSFFRMFYQARRFNNGGSASIGNWNINTALNVDMSSMFQQSDDFNQPLNWNTSKVTSISAMFQFVYYFNHPLNWDMSNCTNMANSFQGAYAFNQPLNWNTSKVNTMSAMFIDADAFNQNIGSWNVSLVSNFTFFMNSKTPAKFSSANLDAIYNGWSTRPVLATKTIPFGTAKYTSASSAGRAILTGAPNNWTITDGGV